MSFAARITRTPRPYDPALGDEAVARLGRADVEPLIRGVAGCSPYLAGLVGREAEWLDTALDGAPEAAAAEELARIAALEVGDLKPGLRQAKRRIALLTALADLGGVWPLEEVTGTLTRLADAAVEVTIARLVEQAVARRKLPETEAPCGGLFALAMGKMGAFELNYSSDIDLIMLFDETAYAPGEYLDARAGLVRVTRTMAQILSDVTADGYVFRTDLRLRPDASVTPVCLSMEAAERYYESLGRTWERAAYIKARAAAGDRSAGERFLGDITPFIWRRHLDYAAIQDAYDMRNRIRSHKGLYDRDALEGYDLKLARGGIREIEFFTQTRQLIAGGRDADLRSRQTVAALDQLAAKGWIPRDVATGLQEDYRDWRGLEHHVQMVDDRQTQALPRDAAGFDRLAAMADTTTDNLRAEIAARRARVGDVADAFFNPPTPEAEPDDEMPREVAEIVARWQGYPALRSQRASEIFRRVRPRFLERLDASAQPLETLHHIDGFLAGLPAGVQLFSLFDANPQLIDLVVDIADISPDLASYLARNARVFDAVIAGDFFADWPGAAALSEALAGEMRRAGDYERQLDRARGWAKEWHFRIGVHHLTGVIGAEDAGRQYAELAEAVLAALFPAVVAEFSEKHGPPPGRGAAVVGMGSLGIGRLNAGSDLDLIVIYDAEGAEGSEGKRPLATRPYFARLTQAFVTALSAPMAEGRLYEVDMRLRPSGRQGPVATSLASFRSYQMTEAWTWEHLALTRARPLAGSAGIGRDIEAVRHEVLALGRARDKILSDVREMRRRIAAAKAPSGQLDPKIGAGRLQDIELLAQTGALLAGSDARAPLEQIAEGAGALGLSAPEAAALSAAYAHFWALTAAQRLIGAVPADPDEIAGGTAAFLAKATATDDIGDLTARTLRHAGEAGRITTRCLGEETE